MYFDDNQRARMTVDAFMLGVFRTLSTSPPVRMLALGLLTEQVIPSFEKDPDASILVTLLKAVTEAMIRDAENDASKALDAALNKALGSKDLLPM